MRINAGLDTGDMLGHVSTPIGPDETAMELSPRLAQLGADLLLHTMRELATGTETAVPQNDAQATLAPILTKEDGLIDWNRSAAEIHNRTRGFLPWPGAYSYFRNQRVHLWKTRWTSQPSTLPPGELLANRQGLFCGCGDRNMLEILELQVEGRKRVPAAAFVNGQRILDRERLGEHKS